MKKKGAYAATVAAQTDENHRADGPGAAHRPLGRFVDDEGTKSTAVMPYQPPPAELVYARPKRASRGSHRNRNSRDTRLRVPVKWRIFGLAATGHARRS